MGTARAPVCASGRWPACRARVLKPNAWSAESPFEEARLLTEQESVSSDIRPDCTLSDRRYRPDFDSAPASWAFDSSDRPSDSVFGVHSERLFLTDRLLVCIVILNRSAPEDRQGRLR